MPYRGSLLHEEVHITPDQLHRSMIAAVSKFAESRGLQCQPGPVNTSSCSDAANHLDVGPKHLYGSMSPSSECSGKHLISCSDLVGGNSKAEPCVPASIRPTVEAKAFVTVSSCSSAVCNAFTGNVTSCPPAQGLWGCPAPDIRGIDDSCPSFRTMGQDHVAAATSALGLTTADLYPAPPTGSAASTAIGGPSSELSPAVQQLLLSLPAEQQKLFADALSTSSFPQQLVQAMQAGSADASDAFSNLLPSAALPSAVSNGTSANVQPGPPNSCGAQSAFANASMQAMDSLQAQAAFLYQQQQSFAAAQGGTPGVLPGQDLLQALAVQQQTLLQQPAAQASAMAQFSALGGISQSLPVPGTGLASSYPALGRASSGPSVAWPLLSSLSAPPVDTALAAAASAALQQEQSSLMQAALSCAGSPAALYNPLAAQLLSAQLAAAAAASSAVLDPVSAIAAAAAAGLSRYGSNAGFYPQQQNLSSAAATGSRGSPPSGWKNRRNRLGSQRSGSIPLGRESSNHSAHMSRSSTKDPGMTAPVIPAGLSVKALSPTSFEDNWGSEETAANDRAGSQPESCCGAYSDSLSSSSSSSDSVAICSRRSSVVSVGSPAACTRYSSADGEVFTLELGPSGCLGAGQIKEHMDAMLAGDNTGVNDAVKGSSRDQNTAQDGCPAGKLNTAGDTTPTGLPSIIEVQLQRRSSATEQSLQSFAVWYPSAGDRCGDDSWYLQLPRTSRLFVGNIGCWVDEGLLLSYFGRYGSVVDVQVCNS